MLRWFVVLNEVKDPLDAAQYSALAGSHVSWVFRRRRTPPQDDKLFVVLSETLRCTHR